MRALSALIIISFLACPMLESALGAPIPFVAADFSLQVAAPSATFRPGDVVVLDGILTNLSTQVAGFGTDVALVGASTGPEINGTFVLVFPFIESYEVHVFPDQEIQPGDNVRFPFLFVDTGASTPLGTIISSGGGNLLFQNIPPSTSDFLVDFFVPISNLASVIAVPEPSSSLLLAIGVAAVLWSHRRYPSCLGARFSGSIPVPCTQ